MKAEADINAEWWKYKLKSPFGCSPRSLPHHVCCTAICLSASQFSALLTNHTLNITNLFVFSPFFGCRYPFWLNEIYEMASK